MKNILNNESLRLARTYLGMTQKQFSDETCVSQSLISKIEKDLKPLTSDVVEKIKDKFGEEFFSQKMSHPDLKVHYRTSASMAKKVKNLFESRLQIIANNIEQITEYIDLPENKVPKKDLEFDFNLDAKFLAREIRQYFQLGMSPIKDLVKVLESYGILIYFYDYDFISSQNKNLDGVSFYVSGAPVILINRKIQGARKIFTLAHELGHLIMHNHNDFILSIDRDVEKEANLFASEFIAPEHLLIEHLRYASITNLFELKSYWKLSAAALLYKASKTSMSKDRHRRLITKMAPYRKNEPNDLLVSEPTVFKEAFKLLEEEYGQFFYKMLSMSSTLFEEVYGNLISNKTKIPKMSIIR